MNLIQSFIRLLFGAAAGWLVKHGIDESSIPAGLIDEVSAGVVAALSLWWSHKHQKKLIAQTPPERNE